ncbi:hypothetical protein [Streptomyces lincolnensis]|nr:hypothetical protein [Streptomyces lincolnensis]
MGDGILQRRSWRWFQARVFGLLSSETRLHRHFAPPPDKKQKFRR